MRMIVEEEYGYRYWTWNVDGTRQDIQCKFNEAISVPGYYAERDNLDGEWNEVEYSEWHKRVMDNDFDGYVHLHEDHDSEIHWRNTNEKN